MINKACVAFRASVLGGFAVLAALVLLILWALYDFAVIALKVYKAVPERFK